MGGRIVIKPTCHTVNQQGMIDYDYPLDSLKDDVISLSKLNAEGLKNECKERWNVFSKFPIPSNYSRYKAAYDLAKKLGLDVSLNTVSNDKAQTEYGIEREF